MKHVAFLGTGMIGAGLAEAAIARGNVVTVWNRTRGKAEKLQALGARVANDPQSAVAGAERVHIALSDDAAVDVVLDACGESLGSTVVVDHTTDSPAGTVARATRLEARGVPFVHAPVFMSPAMCREAKGIMLAAGSSAAFERVRAELEKMTAKLVYVGERRDLAAAYKLMGNAMILAVVAGLSDVYAMAKALDISPADAHGLFSTFNPAGVLTYRGSAMSRGDYTASFELSMARKDARLMIESAAGETLAVLPAIAARMDALIQKGHAEDDLGVLSIESVPRR
jgi:3-hydroxyisobutyrate dehydrogenase